MAAIEAIGAIEILTARHIDGGLALSRETGWNQTDEDWRIFIESGVVFGRRDETGRLAATAALLPSGRTTWISMVLTTPAYRRRGLAATLMRRCIDEAGARNLDMFLDATPAGAVVYGSMGFVATGLDFQRFRRSGAPQKTPRPCDCNASRAERLVAMDGRALGFDRSSILRRLSMRPGSRIYADDGGVALARRGDRARHIGPVYADSEAAAISLLRETLAEPGETVIDLIAERRAVRSFLESAGFVLERPFARMRYGAHASAVTPPAMIAVAGPEFG